MHTSFLLERVNSKLIIAQGVISVNRQKARIATLDTLSLNQGVQGSSPWRRTLKNWFLGHRSPGVGSFFAIKRYGGVPESKYFFTGQRNRAILKLAKVKEFARTKCHTKTPGAIPGSFITRLTARNTATHQHLHTHCTTQPKERV